MGANGQTGKGTVSTGVFRQHLLTEAKQCLRDRLRSVKWVYEFEPFALGKKRAEAIEGYRERVETITAFLPRNGAR